MQASSGASAPNLVSGWNGRPISLIVPAKPLEVFDGKVVPLLELDAGSFADGFHHVDDWVPQRLVTATGPNPLTR